MFFEKTQHGEIKKYINILYGNCDAHCFMFQLTLAQSFEGLRKDNATGILKQRSCEQSHYFLFKDRNAWKQRCWSKTSVKTITKCLWAGEF